MVVVPGRIETLVLVMVRSLVVPLGLPMGSTLPSMVTKSAPFKSISGASRLPVILRPVSVG